MLNLQQVPSSPGAITASKIGCKTHCLFSEIWFAHLYTEQVPSSPGAITASSRMCLKSNGSSTTSVDIISAIEFDKSGDHLAAGDRGGRVERSDDRDNASRRELERQDYPIDRHPEFRYKTKFQSHEPEFDYLKSLEIEEKINKVEWCQKANNALFLLSTNDKTIKYCEVQEKKVKRISLMNLDTSQSSDNGTTSSSSTSSSRALLPNGGCSEKLYNCPNKDLPFPPGGCASLRLPVVVVLDPSSVVLYSMIHQQCMHIH